ncbi:diguanylate cyclase domain-containing protein [Algicola sagamiensis]|uniref:diguanylate cyclase domain-containing protein n=1 Tax=Algicola sagamiensis TaxID=163869 RepID=UPI000363C129|nr:diguanylate cyclase [Algicola sagamiensis]
MKFNSSLEKSHEISKATIAFLHEHQLPTDPVHYTVAYRYISGDNVELQNLIQQRLEYDLPIDYYFIQELYHRFCQSPQKAETSFFEEIYDDTSGLGTEVELRKEELAHYLDALDKGLIGLDENHMETSREVISHLIDETLVVKESQRMYRDRLSQSGLFYQDFLSQIDAIKQKELMDPLTGLYNSNAMEIYVKEWLEEDPHRQICAISLDIQDLYSFSKRYGTSVGEVILNSIANKIRDYVKDSGFPVRMGGKEFIILLPDVSVESGLEIADLIQRGVGKLRFISSKTRKHLPRVQVTIGFSVYQQEENLYQFVQRANRERISEKRLQMSYTSH